MLTFKGFLPSVDTFVFLYSYKIIWFKKLAPFAYVVRSQCGVHTLQSDLAI
jgi:hypothetical protein